MLWEDRERAFGCQGELLGTGRINQEGREIRKLSIEDSKETYWGSGVVWGPGCPSFQGSSDLQSWFSLVSIH